MGIAYKSFFKLDETGRLAAENFKGCLKSTEIFQALDKEAQENTPARFLGALMEMCEGLFTLPPEMTTFPLAENPFSMMGKMQQKIEKTDIDFVALCPHHLMPYFGKADVLYIPKDKYVGISKIDRMVKWCAKRPITQEELGEMIITRLVGALGCDYIRVIINAKHTCNCCRGVTSNSMTSTVHEIDLRGGSNENECTE